MFAALHAIMQLNGLGILRKQQLRSAETQPVPRVALHAAASSTALIRGHGSCPGPGSLGNVYFGDTGQSPPWPRSCIRRARAHALWSHTCIETHLGWCWCRCWCCAGAVAGTSSSTLSLERQRDRETEPKVHGQPVPAPAHVHTVRTLFLSFSFATRSTGFDPAPTNQRGSAHAR